MVKRHHRTFVSSRCSSLSLCVFPFVRRFRPSCFVLPSRVVVCGAPARVHISVCCRVVVVLCECVFRPWCFFLPRVLFCAAPRRVFTFWVVVVSLSFAARFSFCRLLPWCAFSDLRGAVFQSSVVRFFRARRRNRRRRTAADQEGKAVVREVDGSMESGSVRTRRVKGRCNIAGQPPADRRRG